MNNKTVVRKGIFCIGQKFLKATGIYTNTLKKLFQSKFNETEDDTLGKRLRQ